MFGGRVAVYSIGTYVYRACVHSVRVCVSMNTVPLCHCMVFCMLCACPLHVGILFVCLHTTSQIPLDLWWTLLSPVRG